MTDKLIERIEVSAPTKRMARILGCVTDWADQPHEQMQELARTALQGAADV